MNSASWNDGSKIYFQNLNSCNFVAVAIDPTEYVCTDGYATITNPMGTKVCKLNFVSYAGRNKTYAYQINNKVSCRYK